MEQVLDVYQRPYDPRRPVVAMDEQPKQLISDPRLIMPTIDIQRQSRRMLREHLPGRRHSPAALARPAIRSIWIVDLTKQALRLVTAYPKA